MFHILVKSAVAVWDKNVIEAEKDGVLIELLHRAFQLIEKEDMIVHEILLSFEMKELFINVLEEVMVGKERLWTSGMRVCPDLPMVVFRGRRSESIK